jgi:hypothetical protein
MRVDFEKSQSSKIIGTFHHQTDKWQHIWELEDLKFRIFARGRATKILVVGAEKDTWREINILLIRILEKP